MRLLRDLSNCCLPNTTLKELPGALPKLLLGNTPGLSDPSRPADVPAESTPNTTLKELPRALLKLLLTNTPGRLFSSGPVNAPPEALERRHCP